jgi:hypothetical protein
MEALNAASPPMTHNSTKGDKPGLRPAGNSGILTA